jgi:hypothetical protein
MGACLYHARKSEFVSVKTENNGTIKVHNLKYTCTYAELYPPLFSVPFMGRNLLAGNVKRMEKNYKQGDIKYVALFDTNNDFTRVGVYDWSKMATPRWSDTNDLPELVGILEKNGNRWVFADI